RLALQNFEIQGVSTTIPFHQLLLSDPAFLSGGVYTTYVESEMKDRYMNLGKPAAAGQGAAPSPGGVAEPEVARAATRRFEVNLNQRHFNVAVTELVSGGHADSARPAAKTGASAPAARLAKPRAAATPAPGKPNHSGEIRAAMHGIVKQVLVKEGEAGGGGRKSFG